MVYIGKKEIFLQAMYKFTPEIIDKLLSQEEYNQFSEDIVSKKYTEAPYDDEAYFQYTEVNFNRANKAIRNFQLDKKLYNAVSEGINDWTWVLISEPWCGDASFIQPVLYAMSLASGGSINFKIVLRDKHHDIMNSYLTNGGMAIPKLVCLDKNLKELGTWGPRPEALQTEFDEWKKSPDFDLNAKIKLLNRWYIKDKDQHIQAELIDLIKTWKKTQDVK